MTDNHRAPGPAANEEPAVHVVCSVCGGTNVQVKVYINPNTLQIVDDGVEEGLEELTANNETWCSDCQDCVWLREEPNERTDR